MHCDGYNGLVIEPLKRDFNEVVSSVRGIHPPVYGSGSKILVYNFGD